MSAKRALKVVWTKVSSDPGMLAGTIQLVVAISDLVVRGLNKRRERKQLTEGDQ